jgi:hypothetical protein
MTPTRKGSWPDRVWTAFFPRPSTLQRRSDRAEVLARRLALLVLVVSVPFLLAFGDARVQGMRDVGMHERATSHPVTATVTRVAPRTDYLGGTPDTAVDVTATWVAQDGSTHTTTDLGYRGATVGDSWTMWVDGAGHQVRAPVSDLQATVDGVLLAMWTFLAVASGLVGLLAGLHWVLGRRRMADWDEDWALFRLGRGPEIPG